MSLAEKFADGKTVYSFEVFPPKRTMPVDTIYKTLDGLYTLAPDFISVTYGAAGNLADDATCRIAADIQDKYHIESAAHLTCVGNNREEVLALLASFKAAGIQNIMALRGDISPKTPPKSDFRYASELITFIRAHDDSFHISAACYPEGHVECDSLEEDIVHLKEKVDAGAEHLVSQLFFDNGLFYTFLDKARAAGVCVPIEAGIMPVVNKSQIERMVALCGASLPRKFVRVMSRYEAHPQALRDAGIAYAAEQIIDLVANGVQGIHLYTMNNPYVAQKITEAVSSVVRLA